MSEENCRSHDSRDSRALPILRPQTQWEKLYFYQKTVVLYQMTVVFCRRFLPRYGDRTVDQMVQAARSGKQNIVEGLAAGVTSMEMELKLLNVARASIQELKEDYLDYLATHGITNWKYGHPRFDRLLQFCRSHNRVEEYLPFLETWSAEEFSNCAQTLCHMVDRMMASYLARKADEFREQGGIRERMTASRLARRQVQQEELMALRAENEQLKADITYMRRTLKMARNARSFFTHVHNLSTLALAILLCLLASGCITKG